MANLKQSGTRISQYQTAQVNTNEQKEKLLLNHFLISYAPAYYGIGTVNKNFKIPVQSLRDDFKGYIGLVNAKGDWRNSIRFWSGNWSDADRTNSYIYRWDTTLRGEYDYISNKFDVEQGIDKIFLLKTAPWPLEAEQADPAPESNKFVNKKYIDDRFNGIRKVTVSDTTLQIRPYPCVYEYSAMPSSINIVDTLTLEDGRTIKDCIEKNCLIFYIKLPTPTSTTLSVKANNVDTKWGFSGELTQLLSTAKNNADSGLIKCYAEYINGTFTVHCTNGMNLKPGEGGTVTIDTITGDDFINCSKNDTNVSLTLNTTAEIIDSSVHVPTSESIYETLVARTKVQETSQTINSISSDISGNTQGGQGTYYGFYFTPSHAMSIQSIKIKGVTSIGQNVSASTNTIENCHIKIFSRETNLVSSSLTTKTLDDNGYLVWEVTPFIAKAGTQYIVTFNTNNTGNSFEKEYAIYFTPLYKSYENITPQPFGLVNNSLSNTSAGWTPEIQLNYKVIVERTDCEIPNEFYGEYLNNHHNISHKFDYNITQKQVKSYQDGTVTFADDSQIQYDIYPATIANYAFRQSSTESLRTLEKFNERIKGHGVPGNNYTSYYYHERDAISPANNNLYDDDLSENTTPCRHLGNIINGNQMFLRSKLTVFNDNLTSLTSARQMFSSSNLLTEFRSALPSLTYGDKMFNGCSLKIFRTKLPRLSHAEGMFRTNRSLVYVDTVLPSLTYAQGMFGRCDKLKRIDLSENSGECLYNADDMFAGCSSLTYCKLNLSYLETARNMFGIDSSYGNPKLDIESIKYMCETIKDWKTLNNWMNKEENISVKNEIEIHPHLITFGINQSGDSYRNSSETDENNYKFYIEKARKKGWDVTIYYSGGASEVYSAL